MFFLNIKKTFFVHFSFTITFSLIQINFAISEFYEFPFLYSLFCFLFTLHKKPATLSMFSCCPCFCIFVLMSKWWSCKILAVNLRASFSASWTFEQNWSRSGAKGYRNPILDGCTVISMFQNCFCDGFCVCIFFLSSV